MKDKKKSKFSVRDRLKSFRYAFDGLKTLFAEEHNARIHAVVTAIVLIMGFLLHISSSEWLIVLVLIGVVFAAELINSAIENLCDQVSTEYSDLIKKAKDLTSAAVLVLATIAVVCGIIIFLPKIIDLLF